MFLDQYVLAFGCVITGLTTLDLKNLRGKEVTASSTWRVYDTLYTMNVLIVNSSFERSVTKRPPGARRHCNDERLILHEFAMPTAM